MKMPCCIEALTEDDNNVKTIRCEAPAVWLVESGDRETGPHAMSSSCDEHLEDVKRWAAGITALTPRVTAR